MDKRTYQTSAGDWRFFHPDRTGQGRLLSTIARWLGDGRPVEFKVYKAKSVYDLQMLGCVYWTLVLRPDLALLNASDAVRLDRIKTKYVN